MRLHDDNIMWENYILLESFRDYLNKNNNSEEAIETVERFKAERNHLKPPHNDIGFWIQKPVEELNEYLNELPLSKREMVKRQKEIGLDDMKTDENVDIIYADDDYIALGIKNFEGSRKWCGQTTDWCITKNHGHYDEYTKDHIFVFLFDLNLEPYNIHNKSGNGASKLSLQIDNEGDIATIHDAPDINVTRQFYSEVKELPFWNKIEEWAIENFDSIVGESFHKNLKEAEKEAENNNKKFKHGSIHVQGENRDEWYVWGNFTYDLSVISIRENLSGSYIRMLADTYFNTYDNFEFYENKLNRYIEYEDTGYGGNPIYGAVEDVAYRIVFLESDYYEKLYGFIDEMLEAGYLEEEQDNIILTLRDSGYDLIHENNLVLVKQVEVYELKQKLENMFKEEMVDLILDNWERHAFEQEHQMELDLKYESLSPNRRQNLQNLISDLFVLTSTTEKNQYGGTQTVRNIGLNLEVLEKMDEYTFVSSSRDLNTKETKEKQFDIETITKILKNKDKLAKIADERLKIIISQERTSHYLTDWK
jgi:hypothetical protein